MNTRQREENTRQQRGENRTEENTRQRVEIMAKPHLGVRLLHGRRCDDVAELDVAHGVTGGHDVLVVDVPEKGRVGLGMRGCVMLVSDAA
jgi:hypothetical protein